MEQPAGIPLDRNEHRLTAVARTLWLVIAIGVLVLVITAVPLRYQMLLDDPYGYSAPLAVMGISLHFFASYFVFWELLLAVGAWSVGVIIAWRKSDDWFALLSAVTLMLIGFVPPLLDGLILANAAWTWPITFLRTLAFTGLIVIFSLFPNGRFVPRWLRFVLVGWLVNVVVGLLFFSGGLADTAIMPNTNTLADALWLIYRVAWFVPVLIGQWYRYRRVSTAVEQQQTKWVVWGFTIPVLISLFNAILMLAIPALRTDLLSNTVLTLTLGVLLLVSTLLIPLTLAFAIFRYRLWQIDIILNRTLVYGGLTAGVTAVYVLLVASVGSLAASEQSNLAAVLVATILVIGGIRPLHRKWQHQVDNWLPRPPIKQAGTKSKVIGLPWLRATWGFFTLLALILFSVGLRYQAQHGFWRLLPTELLDAAPLLANPFESEFFVSQNLYPIVLIAGYIQAAIFVSVGLFLFWRKSDAVMGILASWLLLAIGLGFTPTIIFLPLLAPAWHLPTSLFQAGLFGAAFLFLCLFPNGRFYPRWSRYATVVWLGYVLLWLFWPQLNLHRAQTIWPAAVFVGIMWLGVAAQLWRYRHISSSDEKQQTKWVIAGFAVANLGLLGIALLLTFEHVLSPTLLTRAILFLPLLPMLIPLSIAIALLRYRLWQIDIIINRTLVYGGLSLGVVAVYALTVGGLSLLFQGQNNLLISLLATGLIAVLFQPVRERLQRGVNRFIFGERDDPYAVLSKLGQQLQETAVPGQTLPTITATICQTLKLPYAAIIVQTEAGGRNTVAASGQWASLQEEWPLRYQGQIIGWLAVAPRSPREWFTDHEKQLLGDIASQAGAAIYATRLTTALQRSREKLVLTREEERRRIRRDLHDGLGPSLASQTFALDTALDLLETDPTAAADLLRGLKTQNQSLVADIRRLVYELRPPTLDELGLAQALAIHVQQLNGRHATQVHLHTPPETVEFLAAAVEVAIYRLVQEGVNNVLRHAQAATCTVAIRTQQPLLTLTISDDGCGIPSQVQPGVGLTSMRERVEELGGTFAIAPQFPRGTLLTAVLPLSHPYDQIVVAMSEDLPVVMEIIGEAAAWLEAKGIEQWPYPPNKHWWRRTAAAIERGEIYLAYQEGLAVGTLGLTWADAYWPDDGQAGYVHRLAICNQVHGQEMGRALLNWAAEQIRQRHRSLLRLDVPMANGRLRRYYEEQGFALCGTVSDHDYEAALYEKNVATDP